MNRTPAAIVIGSGRLFYLPGAWIERGVRGWMLRNFPTSWLKAFSRIWYWRHHPLKPKERK